MTVSVIGAGLAGVEAANTLAAQGFDVSLFEMKPEKYTPAHSYSGFAELVCSNSLKASRVESASGLLKEEMRRLGSLTLAAAELAKVDAGGALAVDREMFSDIITERINSNPKIKVHHTEATCFPERNAVICTGPLTGGTFADCISKRCGDALSFFDAAAPIVTRDSINMDKAFFAARYDRGGADYINCPMTRDEYELFHAELVNAQIAPLHEFDKQPNVYEGCMPVEVLAKRGLDSVRYGCMKPVGLTDPKTGKRPYAVLQLRAENKQGTLYNLVGFQTNLKFSEQKRVFGMIPGLENAEYARYGVMHRNTFLDSPKILDRYFMLKNSENIFFAGQITGVEGYMESAGSGIIAALSLAARLKEKEPPALPETTMLGALSRHVSGDSPNFQPMGANMGILPPLGRDIRAKQERYAAFAERALRDLDEVINRVDILRKVQV